MDRVDANRYAEQFTQTIVRPEVDLPNSVISGAVTGGIAGSIFGGPVGFVGGAAFGAVGGLAGALTRATVKLICFPCSSVSPAVDAAVAVVAFALSVIAAFAAGWAVLTAMGIILPLGSVVILSLIQAGVGLAIFLVLTAIVVACCCCCGCIALCVAAASP